MRVRFSKKPIVSNRRFGPVKRSQKVCTLASGGTRTVEVELTKTVAASLSIPP